MDTEMFQKWLEQYQREIKEPSISNQSFSNLFYRGISLLDHSWNKIADRLNVGILTVGYWIDGKKPTSQRYAQTGSKQPPSTGYL